MLQLIKCEKPRVVWFTGDPGFRGSADNCRENNTARIDISVQLTRRRRLLYIVHNVVPQTCIRKYARTLEELISFRLEGIQQNCCLNNFSSTLRA